MVLGIKLEGRLTLLAIVVGPLLALAVQRWRDTRRDHKNRQTEVFRRLILTLKVPLSPTHVDAINSIPLEFNKSPKVIGAWRLYTSHLSDSPTDQRWMDKKFDLLLDLAYNIAQQLGYMHIDKAMLKDDLYVPRGYQDTEEELRQLRKAWLEMMSGRKPLSVTMVGPVQVEPPLPPFLEESKG